MKKLAFSILLTFLIPFCHSQELNCNVQVISPTVQGVEPKLFRSLEEAVYEFMNNRRWTNDEFDIKERIECNLLINITEVTNNTRFTGSIQVQSTRPVYNTSYNSTVLNYTDKDFQITFLENGAIDYSPGIFRNNLSAILAFYAYIIVGMDYDTFSPEGGTPYFNEAQRIVAEAQNASESGWRGSEGDKNRYWLVDNLLHQTFKPLRKCFYEYHRLGFDTMFENPSGATKIITSSIEQLKKVHQVRPSSLNMQLFFLAKLDELTKLYGSADAAQKNRIFPTLKLIDPGNITKYQKMMNKR